MLILVLHIPTCVHTVKVAIKKQKQKKKVNENQTLNKQEHLACQRTRTHVPTYAYIGIMNAKYNRQTGRLMSRVALSEQTPEILTQKETCETW